MEEVEERGVRVSEKTSRSNKKKEETGKRTDIDRRSRRARPHTEAEVPFPLLRYASLPPYCPLGCHATSHSRATPPNGQKSDSAVQSPKVASPFVRTLMLNGIKRNSAQRVPNPSSCSNTLLSFPPRKLLYPVTHGILTTTVAQDSSPSCRPPYLKHETNGFPSMTSGRGVVDAKANALSSSRLKARSAVEGWVLQRPMQKGDRYTAVW